MKTNKFFFGIAAFAAITLASCSKEEPGGKDNGTDKVVNVQMVFKQSRAGITNVEDGHATATNPTVSSIVIDVLDASGATLNTYTYSSDADINALKTPGKKFTVNSNAAKISIKGNPTTETNINKLQGFAVVPLSGESTIVGSSNGSGTETDPYKVNVEIKPELARIEVFGGIEVTGTKTYYAVDVEQIFVNNIKLTENASSLTRIATDQAPWTTIWYDAYKTGGTMENLFSVIVAANVNPDITKSEVIIDVSKYYTTDHNIGLATDKAAGYNIFPQTTVKTDQADVAAEMPHVILHVKLYKTADDYANGKFDANRQFVTVRSFKDKDGSRVTKMDAANIYRFDLSDLKTAFEDGPDPTDPNPEGDKMVVDLTLTVTQWAINDIHPEL